MRTASRPSPTGASLLVAVCALLALTSAAACGKSSDVQANSPSTGAVTTSAPPATSLPGTTQASAAGGYSVAGYDVKAICAQLLIIAKDWDGGGYTGPQPSTPEEKRALAKTFIDEMSAASEELKKVGPPELANDMAAQIEGARRMFAAQTGEAPSSTPNISELSQVGKGQPALDTFAKGNCGFSIWDYEKR